MKSSSSSLARRLITDDGCAVVIADLGVGS